MTFHCRKWRFRLRTSPWSLHNVYEGIWTTGEKNLCVDQAVYEVPDSKRSAAVTMEEPDDLSQCTSQFTVMFMHKTGTGLTYIDQREHMVLEEFVVMVVYKNVCFEYPLQGSLVHSDKTGSQVALLWFHQELIFGKLSQRWTFTRTGFPLRACQSKEDGRHVRKLTDNHSWCKVTPFRAGVCGWQSLLGL